jgi:WD40 repeat protein
VPAGEAPPEPAPLPDDFFHGAWFLRATFAPGREVVAISGRFCCNSLPGGLVLWDLKNDSKRVICHKDLALIYAFAYRPDGKLFATGHRQGAVRLWDAAACKKVADLGGHSARVHAAAFSPDGTLLATAGGDHRVVLWDVTKRTERQSLALGPDAVAKGIALSPDGETLALALSDGTVWLAEVATGKRVGTIGAREEDGGGAVAFSPDGKILACGKSLPNSGAAQDVLLWDTRTRKEMATLGMWGCNGALSCVAFSRDGQSLACGWGNGGVALWDLPQRKARTFISSNSVHSLSFSPDGRILAGGVGHQVKLWDAATGAEVGVKKEEEY